MTIADACLKPESSKILCQTKFRNMQLEASVPELQGSPTRGSMPCIFRHDGRAQDDARRPLYVCLGCHPPGRPARAPRLWSRIEMLVSS